MFEQRLRGYLVIGYACARREAPFGYKEPPEFTIEYGAEVDDEELA